MRTRKRVIALKSFSFGKFPYAHANDSSHTSWNHLEYASIDTLDEHHKIQKQIYETLKSQNKLMKFERRATWYMMLSRDLKYIVKLMASNAKVDVFSAN
jgi:hypothetical protein